MEWQFRRACTGLHSKIRNLCLFFWEKMVQTQEDYGGGKGPITAPDVYLFTVTFTSIKQSSKAIPEM